MTYRHGWDVDTVEQRETGQEQQRGEHTLRMWIHPDSRDYVVQLIDSTDRVKAEAHAESFGQAVERIEMLHSWL